MAQRIPQKQTLVEVTYETGLIECGSLNIFLESLTSNTTVLLTPLERRFWVNTSRMAHQFAVHLTARDTEAEGKQPIYYCTFLAAELVSIGGRGHLLIPVKEMLDDPNVVQRAHLLQEGLQACLVQTLQDNFRVGTLRVPARYRLPDEWVWSAKSTLAGSGIAFYNNQWTRISIPR